MSNRYISNPNGGSINVYPHFPIVYDDLRVPLTTGKTGVTNPPTWTKFKDNGASSIGVYAWAFAYEAVAGNEEQSVV